MDILQELEPQFRERSNTWPLRPNRVEPDPQNGGSPTSEEASAGAQDVQVKQEKGAAADPLGLTVKKSGARRNAWGALSYAELITNAIQSSPEKRLTLSQIYDWMVQNVPYFKDKGDSTSSAGWKNSIRHNLSLHSRFMRIQNEGTGKSSWWVINPDAKPGKAPRRRAGSMDTKSGEKKRGRINKKRQEAIKTAMENRGSPLNGSIDYLDTLALGDFRSRASSNASSCSRLSPIPPDLHDNQVPPMSPIPWDGEMDMSTGTFQVTEHFPELVNSLADSMNLSSQENMDVTSDLNSDPYLSSGAGQEFSSSPKNLHGLSEGMSDQNSLSHLPAPPPYPERSSPVQTTTQSPSVKTPEQPALPSVRVSAELQRRLLDSLRKYTEKSTNCAKTMNFVLTQAQYLLSVNTQQEALRTSEGSQQSSPNPQPMVSHLSPPMGQASPQEKVSPVDQGLSPQQQRALLGQQTQQTGLPDKDQQQNTLQQQTKSILRSALTHGSLIFSQPASTSQLTVGRNQSTPSTDNTTNINANISNLDLSPQHQIQQKLQQQQQPPQQLTSDSNSFLGQLSETGSTGPVVSNVIMHNSSDLSISNNNVPIDVDMDSSSNFMSMSDRDIELITQDLILDGNLDTNFDNINPV